MKTLLKKITMRLFTRKLCYQLSLTMLFAFLLLPLATSARLTSVMAQAEPGTIAYVLQNDATGDEIRLVEPDGSNDRLLWKTGIPGVEGVEDISALAWHPAASDLTFASRHEEACSMYNSDIYTIHANGSGYRRVTAGPACGQTAGLPTGTVSLPIANWTDTNGPFVVYFQGAPEPKSITLAPGSETVVTFTNVADFGNFKQWGVVVFGVYRFFAVTGNADVLAGKTVTSGSITMYGPYTSWGWSSPSWKSDGSQIAYAFGSGTPYSMPANNTLPGMIGAKLFNIADTQFPFNPKFLAWGPAGPHANQLLYVGSDSSFKAGIYLADAGSSSPGTVLLEIDPLEYGNYSLGLTWLPDGSGFLYSKTEGFGEKGNIFEYNFASQTSTRITDFTSGYPRRMSVSPDGTRLIYEYQTSGDWWDGDPSLDLWMMDLDTGESALFVEGGREPAWSPQAISDPGVPVVLDQQVFLPVVIGK